MRIKDKIKANKDYQGPFCYCKKRRAILSADNEVVSVLIMDSKYVHKIGKELAVFMSSLMNLGNIPNDLIRKYWKK